MPRSTTPRTAKDKTNFTVVKGSKYWRSLDLATTARGDLKECFQNVAIFLRDCPAWRGVLGVDEFSKAIVVRNESPLGHKPGHIWRERDDQELGVWLSTKQELTVKSVEQLRLGVVLAAGDAPFHPVRDYLDALAWDGEPRLNTWLARFLNVEPTSYSSLVGRYFLLNMVRRIYEPGCIMRSVPVLEGAQNRGKSRALATLARPWFADTPFRVGDKDAYVAIQGVWLYEIAELQSFSKSEAEAVKAFVSSTKDRFRAPYERNVSDQLRQTVFAATTNATEYLKDWSGGTRFWPVLVGSDLIDLEALALARDQLFAEAVKCYRAGGDEARAYPTEDVHEELFKPEQERRLHAHPWLDIVYEWLEKSTSPSVTVREVLEHGIGMEPREMGRDQQAATRVGMILAKLGWEKKRDGGGRRDYRWYRPQPKAPAAGDLPEVPF
jgi:putative DNA primase/helicase